jgi:hypothetical protein
MFKPKARDSEFYLVNVRIYHAGERVSSAKSLFVVVWASVASPFCELVASGMSSHRFEWNISTFAHYNLARISRYHRVRNNVCASESIDCGRDFHAREGAVRSPRLSSPNANMSPSWLPAVSTLSYLTLSLITTTFVNLSCALLIVQAIRSSPSRSIKNNWNVVIIGAAYVLVVSPSQFK